MLGPTEINKRFGTTAKSPDASAREHDALRREFIRLAQLVDVSMFDGREKSLAMTHLEEASMWAQKALAHSLALAKEQAESVGEEKA